MLVESGPAMVAGQRQCFRRRCRYHFQSWIWEELAHYDDYSGAPSTEQTHVRVRQEAKYSFVVASLLISTFTALMKAMVSFQGDLNAHNVQI
mmetsp:Transcript_27322/g.49390  ORF Transcript_27322/g.49390 Transcript_27322/m.49390 type:complete len:92 (+) Transcript_27322:624-899(+)